MPRSELMGYLLCTRRVPREDFPINIHGMRELRLVLNAADVLDWEMKVPKLPRPPEELLERLAAGDEVAVRIWDETTAVLRGCRSSNPLKVPGFKFASWERWWVTPEEAGILVRVLEEVRKHDIVSVMDRDNREKIEWAVSRDLVQVPLSDEERCRLEEAGHLWPVSDEYFAELLDFASDFARFCDRAKDAGGFLVL